MERYLKRFKATDYGHCIIKEELIISDDEENDDVDVDVETADESIDDSFLEARVEPNVSIETSKSYIKRKRSGSLKNKNEDARNGKQSTLDLFVNVKNSESTKQSENPKNMMNGEKPKVTVEAVPSDELESLCQKFAKSHCQKCNVKRAVIRQKTRCPKCKTRLTYSCETCNKTYRTFTYLSNHLKNQHTSQKKTANRQVHACPVCNKTFSYSRGLLQHRKIQHGVADESGSIEQQCGKCNKMYKSTQKEEHDKICHEKAPFKCDKCSFATYRISLLTRHTFEKHTEFKGKCEKCDKIFTYHSSMIRHLKFFCGKEKGLDCHHCGRKYFRKDKLLQHLDHRHFGGSLRAKTSDESPRICEHCDKVVKPYESMNQHLKRCKSSPLHDGDASVRTCKYCGLTLKPKGWMKRHLGRCESAPANCRVESDIADQPDSDTAWKNLSKAYCERCKAKTPSKKGQQRCKKCDTRLKFSCERCPHIKFKYSTQLPRHLQVKHVKNNEIYRCDECNDSYSRLDYLKRHQKTCHPSDPSTKN